MKLKLLPKSLLKVVSVKGALLRTFHYLGDFQKIALSMSLFLVDLGAFLVKSLLISFTFCRYNISKTFRGLGRYFQGVAVQRERTGLGCTSLKDQVEGRHFNTKQKTFPFYQTGSEISFLGF